MNKNSPEYEEAYKDWRAGLKYKEIAEKYGVSLSAVKSWATRDWKLRGSKPKKKKVATGKHGEVATEKSRVATGKVRRRSRVGEAGAPFGSQNHLKHGLYSKLYQDVLSEEEKAMIQDMDFSNEEAQLEEQIAMLAIREYRLMKDLERMRATGNPDSNKPGMIVDSVIRNEYKREPWSKANPAIEPSEKEKKNGHSYHLTTSAVNSSEIIVKFEAELTRVQKQKAKCIEQLAKIRDDKARCAREEEEAQRKRDAAAEGKPDNNAPVVQIVLPDNGRDKGGG
ncbi:MAG: hypothetical protein E7572_07220 [Ruminococcaceae bacterium]|nr:hypothetical protein [Oscillospiraceae bacterium]